MVGTRAGASSSGSGDSTHQMEARINQLENMNTRLLNLLENNQANKDTDDEGKFYKRLASHNPRTYDGEPDPVKFEDWIAYMEKLLDMVNCPTNLRVKLASFYLDGQADMWWKTVKNIAQRPDFTWDKFLEKLRERFYPPALQTKKECEFLTLRQGKMSIVEYTAKFVELSRFAPDLVKSEKFKVTRNCEGKSICFECKKPGHIAKDCPETTKKNVKEAGYVRTQTGPSRFGMSNAKGNQGASTFNRNNQRGSYANPGKVAGRMYAMGTEEEAQPEFVENDNLDANGSGEAELVKDGGNVISGTFLVNYVPAYVLFDSGASNSFISHSLLKRLNPTPKQSKIDLAIDLPDGLRVKCENLCKECCISIAGTELMADLVQFELGYYDVILGMDWLSKYEAVIECEAQTIQLKTPQGGKIVYQGVMKKSRVKIVSMMKIAKEVRRGRNAYLCHVIDTTTSPLKVEEIPIVKEFPDVFPEELPGLPPNV
ncbi:uncharacterized protein LOC125492845 [Beta vulgaris subsp. vulgaris]|uniref:uncharacterized protein LOC125492845 n=1 Tax=Beta vulgaris subsp. vulgaris TaxID=3555 RepID=UPI002547863C|nr:uncharacterized protein LOC125492845 [Beta vulgaris subsp. vulgaris]